MPSATYELVQGDLHRSSCTVRAGTQYADTHTTNTTTSKRTPHTTDIVGVGPRSAKSGLDLRLK